MAGEKTREAVFAQPDWLRQVPTDRRFPDARLLFTGCGTSFHAAQTGGEAEQALELVLRPQRDADVLVAISHEGGTALTLEAVRAWRGPTWLITGKPESALAEAADEVVVATPAIEESWCHTVSYTCAGQGSGRTRLRLESARLVQVESSGIAGKLPFDFTAEARRVGSCAARAG